MTENKPNSYHEEVPFPRAVFSTSIAKLSPENPLPEGTLLGFIGRSNSGKSSLLNAITNQKGLAKVSKTPGKTKLINVFATKAGFSLIDLPGFGYSKASHKEHKDMMNLLDQFLNEIKSLKVLFILCDCQRNFPDEEIQMIETATLKKILPVVIRTKIDKLNQKDRHAVQKEMEAVMNELGYPFPLFFVSATTGKGIGDIRKFILSKI